MSSSRGPTGPDGAWWPRTRDLARELCALAGVLDPLWGRITHLAVNPRHRSAGPRGLLVVPPGTAAPSAGRLTSPVAARMTV